VDGSNTARTSGFVGVGEVTEDKTVIVTVPTTAEPTLVRAFISGAEAVGRDLTVNPGTWNAGVELSYQWLRGGVSLVGATSSTYHLTAADLGSTISVEVTGTINGASLDVRTASTGTILPGSQALKPTPSITGTPTVEQALTAIAGTWDSGVALSYQWRIDGVAIDGATSDTYLLTPQDFGGAITVTVIGSKEGYVTTEKTSVATSPVAAAPLTLTPVPVVSGISQVGQTVTAASGDWDSGVSLGYQWQRNGVAILGATSDTYLLRSTDFGAAVSVTVTGVKAGYVTTEKTSVATLPVAPGVLSLTSTPLVSGTAAFGQTLTANPGVWDSGVGFSYQWLRDGTVISGAVSKRYVLTSTDVGSALTVTVVGSKYGYVSVTKTSLATSNVSYLQVSAKDDASCVLSFLGTVKCVGLNSFGQLGDGTTVSRSQPVDVVGLPKVSAVSVGGRHVCALTLDGLVYCWGQNSYGQLGDGTTTNRLQPVQVSGLSGVVSLSSGGRHTCATLSDGTAWCWGWNGFTQLGDGSTVDRLSPVKVSGVSSAISVSAGHTNTCVVLSDGAVSCWGNNSLGELGDGTRTNSSTPVSVSGISNAVSVSFGGHHACVVLSDQTVKCWGFNGFGSLGDGTTVDRYSPVVVPGLSGVVSIQTGAYQSCAVLVGGVLKCWGGNRRGQLGDGTQTDRLIPTVVLSVANVVSVGLGYAHGCLVSGAETVKCWGWNVSGQLADGSNTDRLTAVVVSGFRATVAP
jgi:hypothetical protein